MPVETILHHQMIAEMDNPVPFHIEFVKADQKRKAAGSIRKMVAIKLQHSSPNASGNNTPATKKQVSKNPDAVNSTVLVQEIITGKNTLVHTRLIKKFNQKWVNW